MMSDTIQVTIGDEIINVTMAEYSGNGLWGGISGTLADQADLVSALSDKLPITHLTDFVHSDISHANRTALDNVSGVNTGDQDLSGYALKTNVLELDNVTVFTPDNDYEPATKKYVDDNIIGNAVDSVNSKTGVVVLDADDISDALTTNKFTNATDISRLANTSGTNTGDQDLSGYSLTTHNHDLTYAALSHLHTGVYEPADAAIQAHIAAIIGNPHNVMASDIGLGNVENTALSTWAGSSNITTVGTLASLEITGANTSGVLSLSNSDEIISGSEEFGRISFKSNDLTHGTGEIAAIVVKADGTAFGGGTEPNANIIFYTHSDGIAPFTPIERMRITSAGKVGINESSPSWPMQMTNNINSGNYFNVKNTSTAGTAQAGVYGETDSASYLAIAHGSGGTLDRYGFAVGGWAEMLALTGNGLMVGTGSRAKPIVFGTNDAERARITDTGEFGINTTSPARKLEILDASNPQFRLTHTAGSVYTDFQTNSSGCLNVTPTGGSVIFPQGSNSRPGVAFGDGNSGIFEPTDNTIGIALGGVAILYIDSNYFRTYANSYWALRKIIATNTTPNMLPCFQDLDTGIGHAAGDQLSLIAGGVEGIRISEATSISINMGLADNDKTFFGADSDMSIFYNGTNAIINPKEVGTGILDVLGTIQTDGYNSSDGSAGITTSFTNGDGATVTIKNGLITAIA